jgi:hypothetical protein
MLTRRSRRIVGAANDRLMATDFVAHRAASASADDFNPQPSRRQAPSCAVASTGRGGYLRRAPAVRRVVAVFLGVVFVTLVLAAL